MHRSRKLRGTVMAECYATTIMFMSLEDHIRMNQLIRTSIKLRAFDEWYKSLLTDEQDLLVTTLFHFAYQAGADAATWEQAVSIGGLANHPTIVDDIKAFHLTEIGFPDWVGFNEWLRGLSVRDKNTTFQIAVFLFGVAEGAVFGNETVASCNHWWHRDLMDPRVVKAIRNDPEYYRTSMKDDASIKSTAA